MLLFVACGVFVVAAFLSTEFVAFVCMMLFWLLFCVCWFCSVVAFVVCDLYVAFVGFLAFATLHLFVGSLRCCCFCLCWLLIFLLVLRLLF